MTEDISVADKLPASGIGNGRSSEESHDAKSYGAVDLRMGKSRDRVHHISSPNTMNGMKKASEFREASNAHELTDLWLGNNVEVASAIEPERPAIERFDGIAPPTFFIDCMDERAHNRRRNGYPFGVGEILRTDGARVNNMGPSNKSFWRRFYRVKTEAMHRGNQAFVLPFGHFAKIGSGCAAHAESYDEALSCVSDHARRVQEAGKGLVVAIPGMLNTDDKSLQFHSASGTVDTGGLVDDFKLQHGSQVFQEGFLRQPITDPLTSPSVDGKSPEELFGGDDPLIFTNVRYTIAMQEYLLRRIADALHRGGNGLSEIFQEDVIHAILSKITVLKNVDRSVQASLLHQIFWNLPYVIYQRKCLSRMSEENRTVTCSHGAIGVGFGDGFRTVGNNTLLLVKEGQEDDRVPLKISKKVLTHVRERHMPAFPPFAHVNWMVEGGIDRWEAFRESLASIRTLLEIAFEVYGDEMCALTSYSYRDEHVFYPVKVVDDSRLAFATDIRGDMRHFNPHELHAREKEYITNTLLRARARNNGQH